MYILHLQIKVLFLIVLKIPLLMILKMAWNIIQRWKTNVIASLPKIFMIFIFQRLKY